jgi:hypothetical protein
MQCDYSVTGGFLRLYAVAHVRCLHATRRVSISEVQHGGEPGPPAAQRLCVPVQGQQKGRRWQSAECQIRVDHPRWAPTEKWWMRLRRVRRTRSGGRTTMHMMPTMSSLAGLCGLCVSSDCKHHSTNNTTCSNPYAVHAYGIACCVVVKFAFPCSLLSLHRLITAFILKSICIYIALYFTFVHALFKSSMMSSNLSS